MRYKFLLLLIFNAQLLFAQSSDSILSKVRTTKLKSLKETRAYKVKLQLTGIFVQDAKFYLSFIIHNKGGISYPIDFMRFYLSERSRGRRSSVQELEIIPSYIDSIYTVAAKSSQPFIVVIQQFTIAPNKVFSLSVFEFNGARNLELPINNRLLFQARKP